MNKYCRSSSNFKYDEKLVEDPNNVAAEAIRLYSEQAELCVDENMTNEKNESKIEYLTEDNLEKIIQHCQQTNNWNLLRNTIELIFSNRSYLSNSFLKKNFTQNISLKNHLSTTTMSAIPKSRKEFLKKTEFILFYFRYYDT